MLINVARHVALAAALLTLAGPPVRGEELIVDDSRCHALKAEDLAGLEKKLKEAKAIGANDKLVCNGGPKTAITEQNMSLGSILPALGLSFCQDKSLKEKERCAGMSTEAQRAECRAAEEKRWLGIFKLCE
jgi:hypothetical protein